MGSDNYVYCTDFELTNDVNDYRKACKYLQDDDMCKYLIADLEYYKKVDPEYIDSIVDIVWDLRTSNSGKILLTTTRELPGEVLDIISDWVRGQNSDGLGEGFEQQDFAAVYDKDEYGDIDIYDMASFDWETNDYPFYLLTKPSGATIESVAHQVVQSLLEGTSVSQAIFERKYPTEKSPLKVDAPRGAYWLWMDSDGDIYGSVDKPDPTKNIVDARSIFNFTDNGFDNYALDDVIVYVKKYF